MPHFKTNSLALPSLPFSLTTKEGKFSFLELFTSVNQPNFSLLQVHFTPKDSQLKNKDFYGGK